MLLTANGNNRPPKEKPPALSWGGFAGYTRVS
jgi:hypothetical protein